MLYVIVGGALDENGDFQKRKMSSDGNKNDKVHVSEDNFRSRDLRRYRFSTH